jgi:subtilisin family serine protease
MAISQETPTTYYYWGTSSDMWLGFLLDLANRQGSSTNPLVISISYGGPESQFSSVYLHSFRIEALKLAAQGITIVAASGDDGVNCAAGLCSTSAQCGYYPLFPASSPLVTAVGATQVKHVSEMAVLNRVYSFCENDGYFYAYFKNSREKNKRYTVRLSVLPIANRVTLKKITPQISCHLLLCFHQLGLVFRGEKLQRNSLID